MTRLKSLPVGWGPPPPGRTPTISYPFRPNKFNARKTINADGTKYQSGKEAQYGAVLALMLKNGEIQKLDRQVHIPLVINGVKVGEYWADFVVINKDGSEETIEVKGYWKAEARFKWKVFRALYPDRKVTIIGTPFNKPRKKRRPSISNRA